MQQVTFTSGDEMETDMFDAYNQSENLFLIVNLMSKEAGAF